MPISGWRDIHENFTCNAVFLRSRNLILNTRNGIQKDSRARYSAGGVITLKIEIRS